MLHEPLSPGATSVGTCKVLRVKVKPGVVFTDNIFFPPPPEADDSGVCSYLHMCLLCCGYCRVCDGASM